jgi:glycosyltransferase involved in cell wall biosynthesis
MKIAHVVDSMEVGGAETLVWQMCNLQREQGHEPEVYAVAALGALGERMRAEGFVVQSNVGQHLVDSSRHFLRMFRSSRPDVVHLHNPTPTIYAAPAARLAGVPSIVSTRHSLVAPPRNLTMERKYKAAALFCDWIVGICEATTSNIKDAGNAPDRKIVTVYNGAVPVAPPSADKRPAKTGFTLLYVGRLEAVKNLRFLLTAFRAAVAKVPEMRLWVVGDGTERDRLEELTDQLGARSNVTFWGQQMDVAPFFASADAFVMSSVSEGLPMSLLQALSSRLPAVVTDVGGMAEVVRLAQAGITVPLGNAEAMAEALVRMATRANERETFADNAEAAFRAHFTLPVMVERYSQLYRETPRARHLVRK